MRLETTCTATQLVHYPSGMFCTCMSFVHCQPDKIIRISGVAMQPNDLCKSNSEHFYNYHVVSDEH